MDEARSTGSEERSEAHGRREVTPEGGDASGGALHDPVTGSRAAEPDGRGRPGQQQNPGDIEHDIRRTRAEMSQTVDAIERRLAPERLKHEAKGTMHETIDEVRHRFNPQRMANRASNNMIDTIKDHPFPAAAAGLSLGYLFMKAGEGSSHRDYGDHRSYRGRRPYSPYAGSAHYPEQADYSEPSYNAQTRPREAGYARSRPYRPEDSRESGSSAKDQTREIQNRAKEKAGEMSQRTSEQAEAAREQAGEMARQVQHRAQHGARRAQSGLEEFVYENPLAAGALAVGAGALLGSLFPATEKEQEWMGPARDEVVHRGEEAAQQTLQRSKEGARRVGEEAKSAAKREAQHVQEAASQEARGVKEEASQQAEQQT